MQEKKGWRGYVFSREIGGQMIPQRVQNLVIRNYTQKHTLLYFLSATEYYMENCYMILNSVLEDLENLAGVIFYSIVLLPQDTEQRQKTYEKILVNKCELHFALEELAITKEEDINLIEDIIACRELTDQVNSQAFKSWFY